MDNDRVTDIALAILIGVLVGLVILTLVRPSNCEQLGIDYEITVAETGGVCYIETEDGSLVDLVEFLP